MTLSPTQTGLIHFIGIGGIGMSGIAEILHHQGYKVQGSDIAENANTKRLQEKNIKLFFTQQAENIDKAQMVVVSTAIKKNNPELIAAQQKRLPILHRADMLAQLMRLKKSIAVAGTHGKTTTTSLVGTLLDEAGSQPTIINGGIINAYGTNARVGDGEWLVAEADESDGSFTRLPANIGIITNIDHEHLDHFKSFDDIKKAFHDFIENIAFDGMCAVCIDNKEAQTLIAKIQNRRFVTYGKNPQADIQAINIKPMGNTMVFDAYIAASNETISTITLPMLGEHNVLNALAAIVVARELKIDHTTIKNALQKFGGVKRRFTKTGMVNNITIIDDYGHHPTEITAVLKAARGATDKKIIAVVQPHRYSRLAGLLDEFATCLNDANIVIITDVYAAGEEPIENINRDRLVTEIQKHGHRNVLPLSSPEALPALIAEHAKPGDYVICLGAGSISKWANDLPAQLKKILPVKAVS